MFGLHSLVPNLPVSPLALPPRCARIDVAIAASDCEWTVTEKRPLSIYL
jgi:hypothetical protein